MTLMAQVRETKTIAESFKTIQALAWRGDEPKMFAAIEMARALIPCSEKPNYLAFVIEYLSGSLDVCDDQRDAMSDYLAKRAAVNIVRPVVAKTPARNGHFTVCLNGEDDRVTLKISDDFRQDAPAGSKMVAYLCGSDNESDYAGFAFITPEGHVAVWKRFRDGHERQLRALNVLLGADDSADFGLAYALESGRCCRCNRKLTVPASIHAGMGPECAKKG